MFPVSPVTPSSIDALKPAQLDAQERVASVIAGLIPAPVAVDPRTTYALSARAADAVLSLAPTRAAAADIVAAVVPNAATSAITDGKNAGGERASDARVPNLFLVTTTSADVETSDLKAETIRSADDAVKRDAYLYSIAHVDSKVVDAISVYLMCNGVHFRDFKADHPGMNIHWIAVDNKKIVSVWPKITDQWFDK